MTKAANLAALGSVVEVPSGSAPSFQCRAWVNFNGTGTVAIRGSGNVSSITDISAGKYQINFTTAMSDANYVTCITGGYWPGTDARLITVVDSDYAQTVSAFRIQSVMTDAVGRDSDRYGVSIFR